MTDLVLKTLFMTFKISKSPLFANFHWNFQDILIFETEKVIVIVYLDMFFEKFITKCDFLTKFSKWMAVVHNL